MLNGAAAEPVALSSCGAAGRFAGWWCAAAAAGSGESSDPYDEA
jgi:hypothetical protein